MGEGWERGSTGGACWRRHALRIAVRAVAYIAAAVAVTVWVITMAACRPRYAVEIDPTATRPRVGCIASSPFPAFQAKHKVSGSRLLPEIVRVIGVTSLEDGERWKVLRQGETDPENWVPYARGEIQFGGGCGPEAAAFEELQRPGPADQ